MEILQADHSWPPGRAFLYLTEKWDANPKVCFDRLKTKKKGGGGGEGGEKID
jgi:hypothetical protein